MDDFHLQHPPTLSQSQAQEQFDSVLQLLTYLGFTFKPSKNIEPARVVEFIGFVIDSREQHVTIGGERADKLLAAIDEFEAGCVHSDPSRRDLAALTGKLQWVAPFNPGLELAIDLQHPLPTFQNANFGCNASLLGAAFADTKVPGFLSLENCIRTMPSFQPIWDYPTYKGTGLTPHWQTALARQLVPALPLFKSGAIAGVFLGDEMLCSKVPFSNYSAVATAVRKWLTDSGLEKSLLYSNECSTSLIVGPPATCRQGNLSGCPAHKK